MNYLAKIISLAILSLIFSGSNLLSQPNGNIRGVELANREVLTPKQLHDNFLKSGRKILVIYGSRDESIFEFLQRSERLNNWRRTYKVTIKSDLETDISEIQNTALLLIGSPLSNRFIPKILQQTPFILKSKNFTFFGKNYDIKTTLVKFLYSNPISPTLPMLVVMGMQQDLLNPEIYESGLYFRNQFKLFRNSLIIRAGRFKLDSTNTWIVDPESEVDFENDLIYARNSKYFRIYVQRDALSNDQVETFIRSTDELVQVYQSFFGGHESWVTKINCYLYGKAQDKVLFTRNPILIENKWNGLHVAFENGLYKVRLAAELYQLIWPGPGNEKIPLLKRGLAVYLANNWHDSTYDYWAAKIWYAGLVQPLEKLLRNPTYKMSNSRWIADFTISELIVEPLAGSLIAFLVQKWGKEDFLIKYNQWIPPSIELQLLETEWQAYLQKEAEKHHAAFIDHKISIPGKSEFKKGFNFTYAGDVRFSDKKDATNFEQTLSHLSKTGANSVALVVNASQRNFNKPAPLRTNYFRAHSGLISAVKIAKKLGLSVLLKPHIRTWEWSGNIEMSSEEDWRIWFDHYEKWLIHNALVAEIYKIEFLSVGAELGKTTIGHPNKWIELINKIRKIYTGKLTYAANWGDEFENLGFWDHLDVIGIDCYYPLSDLDNPTDDELAEGANRIANKLQKVSERFNKPIILTELGFRSDETPWKDPWAREKSSRSTTWLSQSRCYRAMFEALVDKEWCIGIYWWRWLSNSLQEISETGFSPEGKPAEIIVREWFHKFQ